MQTREALRRPPATIEVNQTIRAAAQLMNREAVGALMVTDTGRLVGVVTDRDLVVRGMANGVEPSARIDSMMSTDPVTIAATADLRDSLEVFRAHQFRRLPVTDGEAIAGMLSVDDLVIDLVADLADLVRPVTGQVIFGSPEPSPPAILS